MTLYAGAENAFWLDAGETAERGWSYLGAGARVVRAFDGGRRVVDSTGAHRAGSILDVLAEQPTVVADGVNRYPLGWVGWLGYGVGVETTGAGRADPSHPDAAMMRVDRAVCVDHSTGAVELVAIGTEWRGGLRRWRDGILDLLASPAAPTPDLAPRSTPGAPAWRDSDDGYLAKIARCQQFIRDGDAYQLCLTTEVTIDVHLDPLQTYLRLRATSPSHHGGFIRIGRTALLSSSPEQFLSVSPDGVVETRPIKGTRPRGATASADARNARELAADPKERAENLMIVDLMRNDLGRVCEVGSVSVPQLLAVESYAQVHQLVSTVRGRLAAGRHPVDAIRSCFPAGSMTGAPKLRAMHLLDGLEERARGIYSGAFGWIGADGSIELAMVIRSIVLDERGATIGAGGGITASSIPAAELAEVKLKARAMLSVLGAVDG